MVCDLLQQRVLRVCHGRRVGGWCWWFCLWHEAWYGVVVVPRRSVEGGGVQAECCCSDQYDSVRWQCKEHLQVLLLELLRNLVVDRVSRCLHPLER